MIKAGTDSTDAECGEESSKVTVAVTISVIVFLLIISAGLVCYFFMKKKKTDEGEDDREQLKCYHGFSG